MILIRQQGTTKAQRLQREVPFGGKKKAPMVLVGYVRVCGPLFTSTLNSLFSALFTIQSAQLPKYYEIVMIQPWLSKLVKNTC